MSSHIFRRATGLVIAFSSVVVISPTLFAQQVAPGGNHGVPFFGGGQNITVQGVYIDTKGVLRFRNVGNLAANRFRANSKLGPSFVSISLPRVFAEARRLIKAGKPLPDRVRYLDGLVKLQYIVVDEMNRDLIIAGPAEPIDASNPIRPRGKKTGRPVLHLDDLVVALRSVGPGSRATAFGCTLLQDPKAAERVAALQRRVRTIRGGQRGLQQAMKQAIGPLTAKFFGVPADTRYAFVCIECDYRMKRISLGLESPPVRGMRSYLSMSSGGNLLSWFWFVADYPPLQVSEDGTIFEIPAHGLKLNADNISGKSANRGATQFAEMFSKKLPEMEQAVPGFADLQNLADLAVLAALIDTDHLDRKTGWKIDWLLKPGEFPVQKVVTARQADTLVNFKSRGRRTVTVAGGVRLSVRQFAKKRKTTAGRTKIPRDFRNATDWSRRIEIKD